MGDGAVAPPTGHDTESSLREMESCQQTIDDLNEEHSLKVLHATSK